MTKEDLEKEAEEGYIKRIRQVGVMGNYRNQTYNDGYVDGAESREKQIAVLSERVIQLQKDKGDLIDKLTKAKEIIKTLLSSKTDFDEKRFALWAWKEEEVNKAEQFLSEVEHE